MIKYKYTNPFDNGSDSVLRFLRLASVIYYLSFTIVTDEEKVIILQIVLLL